ncbi:MAG TPA: hypothetical protein VLJ17_10360 [Xanthobacteraceae bacterium]|nr:hypothetical protein [Xanthobacteraceae bacterium]
MSNATAQRRVDLDAIRNHAVMAPEKGPEIKAANENTGNDANNKVRPVAPVVLCGDDARQGVTGHNVRYVLGFGLLGAVVGIATVAFVVGYSFAVMPPG